MRLIPLIKLAGCILRSNLQELPLPYRLTYAVTSRCQARCSMCNIWQKPVEEELTIAEIDLLFSKANYFSWINLTGGELFQRSDIGDIFHCIINRSNNLYLLNFPTNGFQTDTICATVDRILKETKLPRLIVSVSLDGTPIIHNRIRGMSGMWEQAIKTFGYLRTQRSRRFSVYFGHTVQAANLGHFDETLRASNQALGNVTVNDFHFNLAHVSGHYYNNEDTDPLPDPGRAVAEIEQIRRQQSHRILDPVAFIERRYQCHVRDYLSNGRGPFLCQAAGASCFIDPTGIVYPCSVFDRPLGSLRDYGMDFQRLWHSPTRTDTRELVMNSQCPGCWTPCEAYQTLLANLLQRRRRP